MSLSVLCESLRAAATFIGIGASKRSSEPVDLRDGSVFGFRSSIFGESAPPSGVDKSRHVHRFQEKWPRALLADKRNSVKREGSLTQ